MIISQAIHLSNQHQNQNQILNIVLLLDKFLKDILSPSHISFISHHNQNNNHHHEIISNNHHLIFEEKMEEQLFLSQSHQNKDELINFIYSNSVLSYNTISHIISSSNHNDNQDQIFTKLISQNLIVSLSQQLFFHFQNQPPSSSHHLQPSSSLSSNSQNTEITSSHNQPSSSQENEEDIISSNLSYISSIILPSLKNHPPSHNQQNQPSQNIIKTKYSKTFNLLSQLKLTKLQKICQKFSNSLLKISFQKWKEINQIYVENFNISLQFIKYKSIYKISSILYNKFEKLMKLKFQRWKKEIQNEKFVQFHQSSILIQSIIRRFLSKLKVQKMKENALKIQSFIIYLIYQHKKQEKLKIKSILKIQIWFRDYLKRKQNGKELKEKMRWNEIKDD